MAGIAGFEPTNATVKVWCLTAWRYPYVWGERWDSNPRQPVPQTGALPTELHSPKNGAPSGIRTRDTLIKSQVLYQLS